VIAMTHTKHEDCLGFVSEILTVLKSTHQSEQVLHLIVDRVVRMFHCHTCAVVVVDPATEFLHIALGHGLSLTFEKAFRRKLATGAIGRLLWTGSPIFISDCGSDRELADEVKLENSFGSAVCTVIAANQKSMGYLYVDHRSPGAFSLEDLPILQSFADFAAIALHTARLFEDNLRLDRIDHETELEKYFPFLERIQTTIERSKELGESFSLLILDVDNFKHIATTYGYDSSKKVLRQMADLIKNRLRSIDAVGRHGFDEFIVLRSHTDLVEGVLFADELRRTIQDTLFTEHGIQTTVSGGISVYPRHASTLDSLLQSVKEALFDAQRAGRNKVSFSGKDALSENAADIND
jgi:diguanylate cyclase (GGDEF)-like protein